jgi:hypothetical protein
MPPALGVGEKLDDAVEELFAQRLVVGIQRDCGLGCPGFVCEAWFVRVVVRVAVAVLATSPGIVLPDTIGQRWLGAGGCAVVWRQVGQYM